MKFFAAALLSAAGQALSLNDYNPIHSHTISEPVTTYVDVPVTRVRREPITTYDIVDELRLRQVPTTVVDTIEETRYRPELRTRKVPEIVLDEIIHDRRLIHEHSSSSDGYHSELYSDDVVVQGLGLSSELSDESDYSVFKLKSYGPYSSSSDDYKDDYSNSDRKPIYESFEDFRPYNTIRPGHLYGNDSSSYNSDSDSSLTARFGFGPGDFGAHVGAFSDSDSSNSYSLSIDEHYHDYQERELVPRTVYVDEPYTVQVPFTVTRNVPREVLVDEAFTVQIEVPVPGY